MFGISLISTNELNKLNKLRDDRNYYRQQWLDVIDFNDMSRKIHEMWDFWRDNVYGKWEVVATVKHPNGTVVETAQRIVKKGKNNV